MNSLVRGLRPVALALAFIAFAMTSFGQANTPTAQKPEAQTQSQSTEMPATPQSSQTFQGTVSLSQGSYVLKDSSGTTYQLDDQKKAKSYSGQEVKVTGSLDTSSNTIHVNSIAPAS